MAQIIELTDRSGLDYLHALVERGQNLQPLLKEIAAAGVTVTHLSAAERDAFVKATRPVYTKWKAQIGSSLVDKAEKAIAARKQ